MIRRWIFSLWRTLFGHKLFFEFNKVFFHCACRGMGIFNYENDGVTGERYFLGSLKKSLEDGAVIFDVGANIGGYSTLVKELIPNCDLYSFEPHPDTFKELDQKKISRCFNVALGDQEGEVELYFADAESSELSTIYKSVMSDLHHKEARSVVVEQTTLDLFLERNNIPKIHFLKVDVEGHEKSVLYGAKNALSGGRIDIMQIEFNEMNIISKTTFKEIYDFLGDHYFIYRLLPSSVAKISVYEPLSCEIYGFQNLIAVKKNHPLNSRL